MCGRFISTSREKNIKKIFDINKVKNFAKESYNINPQQNINVILFEKKSLILDSIKWGYSFHNNYTNKNQLVINSRLETVNSKYLFKESFFKRKCLVLANGYFEWKNYNNQKIPYFISIPENENIYFAAIWRPEKIKDKIISVCCIITKEANKNLKYIHERMPIILSSNEGLEYLNNNNQFSKNFNKSEIENDLIYYKISKKVNNPKNNYKECILPIN